MLNTCYLTDSLAHSPTYTLNHLHCLFHSLTHSRCLSFTDSLTSLSSCQVCTLPEGVLKDVVSYALWCLQGAQQSGLLQATMFFSVSFCFRPLLQLFDRQDGLRHLVNLVSRNGTV